MYLFWVCFWKKGCHLFNLDTREFFASRDVQFIEDSFPYFGFLSTHARIQRDAYLTQPSIWDDNVYDIGDGLGGLHVKGILI